METMPTSVRLAPDLLERVDALADEWDVSRTTAITRMLEYAARAASDPGSAPATVANVANVAEKIDALAEEVRAARDEERTRGRATGGGWRGLRGK